MDLPSGFYSINGVTVQLAGFIWSGCTKEWAGECPQLTMGTWWEPTHPSQTLGWTETPVPAILLSESQPQIIILDMHLLWSMKLKCGTTRFVWLVSSRFICDKSKEKLYQLCISVSIQDFLYIFICARPVALVMCGHLWNYNWLHFLHSHLCKLIGAGFDRNCTGNPLMIAAHIRRIRESHVFSLLSVHSGGGGGLTASPSHYTSTGPTSFQQGYPSDWSKVPSGEGYPSTRQGVPQSQVRGTPVPGEEVPQSQVGRYLSPR